MMNPIRTTIAFVGLVLSISPVATAQEQSAEQTEFFEKKIRPVLEERCFKCHSAAAPKLKGELRLDTRADLLRGGASGPAIVPGDPDSSLLIKALRYGATGEVVPMPPDGKLADSQIADFIEWVRIGAPDPRDAAPAEPAPPQNKIDYAAARKFWSFQPIANPPLPGVQHEDWVRTDVDRFILAMLEKNNLEPATLADKRTLIRRATFDLIGLPPTPEDIAAFLNDDSPDAFAKVVDRLLASPQYGERWGRHWLDVVRYADSFDSRAGIEQDIAESWRYRDWVVAAFNRDMPYDKFLMNQIAGDLLPPENAPNETFNPDGIIATGVLAIGNWPGGDADKEKMVTDIVDDQIDLVTRGMMGLTVSCARCHDHKFDPISTEDYYALSGIFFSSHILPGPGKKTEGSPILKIPLISKDEIAAREERVARIKQLEDRARVLAETAGKARARRMMPETSRYMLAALDYYRRAENSADLTIEQFAGRSSLDPDSFRLWIDFLGWGEGRLLSTPLRSVAGHPELIGFSGAEDSPSLVANTSDKVISFATITQAPRSITVHPSPTDGVALVWRSPIEGAVKISGRVADADDKCGNGIAWTIERRRRSDEVAILARGEIQNGEIQPFDAVAGADSLDLVSVAPGDSIRLSILPKSDYSCDTTEIHIEIAEIGGAAREWSSTWDLVRDLHEGGRGNPHSDSHGNPAVWSVIDLRGAGREDSNPDSLAAIWRNEIGALALSDGELSSRELARRAAEKIQLAIETADANQENQKQFAALRDQLLSSTSPFWPADPLNSADAPLARLTATGVTRELDDLRGNAPPAIPFAVGIQEGGVPDTEHAGIRDVAVHIRGHYARHGPVVPRGFPKIIAGESQPKIEAGSGRLELARFVASAHNPLTPRVIVNRIWQHHFGAGIVRTPGNFGKLGEPPTHPELLDYLSRRFIDSGWSIKSMHRLIMLSSAYQQSSAPSGRALEADPDNRFFSRMNRRRLESEPIRDSLLAAAGKLDLAMGGPAIADLNSPRRTLYIRTVRSDRATYGTLFDTADSTAITDTRAESTVAPQALFILNNPFVIDRVREIAARASGLDTAATRDKIAWLYETLYGRPPIEREIEIGQNLIAAAENEAKGWEAYAQILVCANEFIYVD